MANQEQDIQSWIENLDNPLPTIRRDACNNLGSVPILTQKAIVALQKALNDHDEYVKSAAWRALASHNIDSSIPTDSSSVAALSPYKAQIEGIQKWQYRWEFAYLYEGAYTLKVGNKELSGKDAWDYLASLGMEGWELVSVTSHIGAVNEEKSTVGKTLLSAAVMGPLVTTMAQNKSGTIGYFFWYKRPMQ